MENASITKTTYHQKMRLLTLVCLILAGCKTYGDIERDAYQQHTANYRAALERVDSWYEAEKKRTGCDRVNMTAAHQKSMANLRDHLPKLENGMVDRTTKEYQEWRAEDERLQKDYNAQVKLYLETCEPLEKTWLDRRGQIVRIYSEGGERLERYIENNRPVVCDRVYNTVTCY